MKITLKRNSGDPQHPWILRYGMHGDCKCCYSTWQEGVWDFPHAIALTFPYLQHITIDTRGCELSPAQVEAAIRNLIQRYPQRVH